VSKLKQLFSKLLLVVSVFAVFISQPGFAATETNADDIVGDWMVNTGDAVVRFYKADGEYRGKVIWAGRESTDWWLEEAPMEIPWENRREAKAYKHAASLGVDILVGLTFDEADTWVEGRVFNVLNGKIYKCQITLPEPEVLKLRGFIGLPVFGGSVEWHKLSDNQRAAMPTFPNRFEHPETWP
jgi:uncharacterized protein (DUF2147 family)